MINYANMLAGNDNPAFKIGTHATEKLTETAFNTASTFADNTLKFTQALSQCRNVHEAFAAASNLVQENAAAAITATQKACSAFLETFSEVGDQCASTLESATQAFDNAKNAGMENMASAAGIKAKKRDKE
jgi:hypothetical protein